MQNFMCTSKISKLLLLMGEGGIERFVGRKLDDIDINLSPIEEENVTPDDVPDYLLNDENMLQVIWNG